MNKTFCKQCGKATEYSLSKPKFCASCGTTFGLISTSNTPSPSVIPVVNPFLSNLSTNPPPARHIDPPQANQGLAFVDLDEDEDPDAAVVSEMQVEIINRNPSKSTIGQIAANPKRLNLAEIASMRPKEGKISKKKFLEDFSREAGALKPQTKNRRNKSNSSE